MEEDGADDQPGDTGWVFCVRTCGAYICQDTTSCWVTGY
jgi:hypothetical protein